MKLGFLYQQTQTNTYCYSNMSSSVAISASKASTTGFSAGTDALASKLQTMISSGATPDQIKAFLDGKHLAKDLASTVEWKKSTKKLNGALHFQHSRLAEMKAEAKEGDWHKEQIKEARAKASAEWATFSDEVKAQWTAKANASTPASAEPKLGGGKRGRPSGSTPKDSFNREWSAKNPRDAGKMTPEQKLARKEARSTAWKLVEVNPELMKTYQAMASSHSVVPKMAGGKRGRQPGSVTAFNKFQEHFKVAHPLTKIKDETDTDYAKRVAEHGTLRKSVWDQIKVGTAVEGFKTKAEYEAEAKTGSKLVVSAPVAVAPIQALAESSDDDSDISDSD
jgi:hypothetical protein